MNIEQEKMIVEALPSLYPLQEFEEKAIHTVLDALPAAQSEPCEDAVSREKVKELAYSQIRNEYSGIALKEQREAMLRIADNVIGLLPSVTPKQRTGKWIKTARWGRVYYCDQCRNYLDFDGVNAGRGSTNFCPNCGADMRGEQ